jgi:hypothetical protein
MRLEFGVKKIGVRPGGYRWCSCGRAYHTNTAVLHATVRHPWEERWCYQ